MPSFIGLRILWVGIGKQNEEVFNRSFWHIASDPVDRIRMHWQQVRVVWMMAKALLKGTKSAHAMFNRDQPTFGMGLCTDNRMPTYPSPNLEIGWGHVLPKIGARRRVGRYRHSVG